MPLSRDSRLDRRKRILRESLPSEEEGATSAAVRTRTRRSPAADEEVTDEPLRRRSAGYSQDVRGACQHRLVQLIPVRRRAYLFAIFASCLIPVALLVLHYWVYVNGYLNWYGQPLAILLDASHPRGIAAWLSGQMWLLCLASTVLTFRLRRHKLDDYNGDYRLWFWLVSTCVIGSLDSTTRVIAVFGDALNRWSQLNLGWSGPAVVQATLAALIGMLGVRLCSELKSVPTSLVFWLVGLVAWAGSAALGQDMLKIDISVQFRIWLRSALWLGGLTSIWLASLSYLRVVYIEAQRRFLLRGRLAASVSSTWKERLTESMPAMPKMPKMPSFRLRRPGDEVEEVVTSKKRTEKAKVEATEKPARRFGLPSFMKRKPVADVDENTTKTVGKERSPDARSDQRTEPLKDSQRDSRAEQRAEQRPTQANGTQANGPLSQARRSETNAGQTSVSKPFTADSNKEQNEKPAAKRSWLSRFVSKPNADDDAPEFRKVDKATRAAEQLAAKQEKQRLKDEQRQAKKAAAANAKGNAEAEGEGNKKRSWMPKLSIPKMKMKMPALPRPKMPKFGLPKLKLPSLRLPPPESSGEPDERASGKPDVRPLPTSKPLPTTNGPAQEALENGGRPLSKAERKRLRRMQDDQDYEAEDRRAA
ncbi:MAG: hypothetical protein SFV81_28075 [Pirellulaceae bacterium]|nr:hypothetical protein [Pirellulaceae bacterium]